jgi:hypothetical protein
MRASTGSYLQISLGYGPSSPYEVILLSTTDWKTGCRQVKYKPGHTIPLAPSYLLSLFFQE